MYNKFLVFIMYCAEFVLRACSLEDLDIGPFFSVFSFFFFVGGGWGLVRRFEVYVIFTAGTKPIKTSFLGAK